MRRLGLEPRLRTCEVVRLLLLFWEESTDSARTLFWCENFKNVPPTVDRLRRISGQQDFVNSIEAGGEGGDSEE